MSGVIPYITLQNNTLTKIKQVKNDEKWDGELSYLSFWGWYGMGWVGVVCDGVGGGGVSYVQFLEECCPNK